MRNGAFTPYRVPFTYTVGVYPSAVVPGDVVRLIHDGKFTVMRVHDCRRGEEGTKVYGTRKQIDRKGRVVRKGRQRRWYFIPNGTPVTVIGDLCRYAS